MDVCLLQNFRVIRDFAVVDIGGNECACFKPKTCVHISTKLGRLYKYNLYILLYSEREWVERKDMLENLILLIDPKKAMQIDTSSLRGGGGGEQIKIKMNIKSVVSLRDVIVL